MRWGIRREKTVETGQDRKEILKGDECPERPQSGVQ
jgi:hypothetical protein